MTKEELDKYLAGHVRLIAREEKELLRITRQAEPGIQPIRNMENPN